MRDRRQPRGGSGPARARYTRPLRTGVAQNARVAQNAPAGYSGRPLFTASPPVPISPEVRPGVAGVAVAGAGRVGGEWPVVAAHLVGVDPDYVAVAEEAVAAAHEPPHLAQRQVQ